MKGAPLTPVMVNALVSEPASRYKYKFYELFKDFVGEKVTKFKLIGLMEA